MGGWKMKKHSSHLTFERALKMLKDKEVSSIRLYSWGWEERVKIKNNKLVHDFDENEHAGILGWELLSDRWEAWIE
jgi:hypothetical protein